MSIYDSILISSNNFVVDFLAVPEGLFWGSRGTTFACELGGFLVEMMTTVALYNFGLFFDYVLIIRDRNSQEYIVRFIEPTIHGVAISIPIALGIWAWVSGALNTGANVGGLCYINEFPAGCTESDKRAQLEDD
jgi:hypothetical protein